MAMPITIRPSGTNEEALGPPTPDDLTVSEWAARDVRRWEETHATLDEAGARLQRLLAVIAFREVVKLEGARRERATLAHRIRWSYNHLIDRMRKPGTEATVELPGEAEMRTQAAGGKPKIEIDDEKVAMRDLRRRGWVRAFTVVKKTVSKTKLQGDLERAKQIRGIRVVHPEPGFFINGKKVDPITGERVGKK